MPAATTKSATAKRFELPALDFKFASLTDGTDIPPPLPSPVKEVHTPPQTPPAGENKENAVKAKVNGSTAEHGVNGASTPTTAEGETHTNGNGAAANGHGRPASRSNTSILDEKKAKRGSGWFRRLRTGDAPAPKRSSLIYEDASRSQKEEPKGPPPPMIPELADLEAKLDDGGLGADLFKNIK